MSGLWGQIEAFAFTLLLGLATGVIFHFYHLIIRHARVGRIALYLLDLSLWLLMIALVFSGLLWINQGEMRFYVLIALIIGILAYFKRLAVKGESLLSRLALGTIKAVSLTIRGITAPFRRLARFFQFLRTKYRTPPSDHDPE